MIIFYGAWSSHTPQKIMKLNICYCPVNRICLATVVSKILQYLITNLPTGTKNPFDWQIEGNYQNDRRKTFKLVFEREAGHLKCKFL